MKEFFDRTVRFLSLWHGPIYAVSAFVLGIFVAWHVLSLATPLSMPEILLMIVCLAGLSAGLWIRGGGMRLLNALATLGIYAGGFAAARLRYPAAHSGPGRVLAFRDKLRGRDAA